MGLLRLSLACWDYDRVKAIQDGRVRPEGIELNFMSMRVEEIFFRQLRHQDFDVCEMSFSSYVLTLNSPNQPFIALPIFPSRMFRHQSIYINANSGIHSAEDLRGKRIGTPEYSITAGVWQRGFMLDEYGVNVESIEWVTGAVEPSKTKRQERLKFTLPDSIHVTPIPDGQCLSQMLADGEIDALFSATQPSSYKTDKVLRLFPNFKQVEMDYYKRTKLFPMMHLLVLKRSVYDKDPWIAKSLVKAFAASLDIAYEAITERAALRYMLPWLEDNLQEVRDVMGDRYWEDGFENNKQALQTFLRYSHEQGLAKKLYTPEELFAPSTLSTFVV